MSCDNMHLHHMMHVNHTHVHTHTHTHSHSKDSTPHSNPEHIQEVPPEMLKLFINVFKEPPSHSLCPVEFTSMQMEMLHVIGAAATGLMVQRSCDCHMPVICLSSPLPALCKSPGHPGDN